MRLVSNLGCRMNIFMRETYKTFLLWKYGVQNKETNFKRSKGELIRSFLPMHTRLVIQYWCQGKWLYLFQITFDSKSRPEVAKFTRKTHCSCLILKLHPKQINLGLKYKVVSHQREQAISWEMHVCMHVFRFLQQISLKNIIKVQKHKNWKEWHPKLALNRAMGVNIDHFRSESRLSNKDNIFLCALF